MIKLLYFVRMRESLGLACEPLELDPSVSGVGGLIAWLCRHGGAWSETFDGRRLPLVTVSDEIADGATRIRDRDEAVLFLRSLMDRSCLGGYRLGQVEWEPTPC